MRDFFDAIYGEQGTGLIEFRAISNNGKVRQSFHEYPRAVDSEVVLVLDTVIDDFERYGFNVFAGILLRTRPEGVADACVKDTPVLWADFDSKDFNNDRMQTFYAVQRMDIPPQIVVDSGHGFHAYWLLETKLPVSTAQILMATMAQKYGSDMVGDPARVMRIPGTLNVKDPEHKVPVRLIKFDPLERARTEDFFEYLIPDKPASRMGPLEYPGEIADISSSLRRLPERGTRSEVIFGVVCQLVRYGYDEDEVLATLLTNPVGEKVQEMDPASGIRWVHTTYNNAVRAVRLG